jgi:hypothetical protein
MVTTSTPRAQQSSSAKAADDRSDLEAFIKQVLTRRDDNWKKLQQYTLEEDETFQVSALNGRKLYGFKREYSWYPSTALGTGPQDPSTVPAGGPSTSLGAGDPIFIRSPISADGVKVSEADRRKAEARWLKQEQDRSKKPAGNSVSKDDEGVHVRVDSEEPAPGLQDLVKPGGEPRFVSSAYFMKFKFDEGSYALAGREKLLGRDVLKIEYYPKRFFQDERKRDDAKNVKSDKERRTEEKIDRKMDKVSMITMWIEPKDHQILQYEFSNIDFDFLPGRALVRLDELRASMRMREAFPNVWLPDTVAMSFGMTLALGEVAARYDVKYHDYKLAEVKTRLR